jgi:hypothetical protein
MPRHEDAELHSLPDDAVVVRGGLMLPRDLDTGALTHYDEFGEYALSVYALPGRTADEIAILVPFRHSKIQTIDCRPLARGRLRSRAFAGAAWAR